MIGSIRHKGLKKFYQTGNASGIRPDQANRLRLILTAMDRAIKPEDMNFPGAGFHKLSGDLKEFYTVKVNKNWRIIFRFEDGKFYDIDLIDYH